MIGVVLVTHGRLAEEFLAAVVHVVGPQTHFATVCIAADDDMEARRQEIMDMVQSVETGDGTILLTDMFGGTPSNLAISLLDQDKTEVIAGVNLPMLIKLATIRGSKALPEVVEEAQSAGRKYINVASELLSDGVV
ncbi:MAG: PTS fructose transporter subunit IIA [Rhodospirillaceae bacterium]|nr:PTS fructose transporter subunit IIA [Rhodospirillaceae bacterium]|tara:strand:+ start:764 stop:1171 length:408 start_codon:yes stop_codon:yes gene_type:complete